MLKTDMMLRTDWKKFLHTSVGPGIVQLPGCRVRLTIARNPGPLVKERPGLRQEVLVMLDHRSTRNPGFRAMTVELSGSKYTGTEAQACTVSGSYRSAKQGLL